MKDAKKESKPKPKKQKPNRPRARPPSPRKDVKRAADLVASALTTQKHPNPQLLKSLVLPPEAPPMRLVQQSSIGTVVRRYASYVSGIGAPFDSTGSTIKFSKAEFWQAVYLYSKQPSRAVGFRATVAESVYGTYRVPATFKRSNNLGEHSVMSFAIFPSNEEMYAVQDEASPYTKVISIKDSARLSILGAPTFDITPVGWTATDNLYSTGPMAPTGHVGLDGFGRTFIHLNASSSLGGGSQLTITLSIRSIKITGTTNLTWRTVIGLVGFDGNGVTDEATASTAITVSNIAFAALDTYQDISCTVVFDSKGTNYDPNTGCRGIIPATGYYKVIILESDFVTGPSSILTFGQNYSYPTARVKLDNPVGALTFRQTPEFYSHPQIYSDCRVTAASFLLSNRTPAIAKGGAVYAKTVNGEKEFVNLFAGAANSDQFFAACAQDAGRSAYEGNCGDGLYHWAPLSQADLDLRSYVSDTGTAVYHLMAGLPVTMVVVSGSTSAQQFYLHWDMCIESAVTRSQTYGNPVTSRMSPEEFSALVRFTSSWPCLLENPTHAMNLLRRIFGGAWRGFQFVAPYLAKAAAATAAGSTPLGALTAAFV